MSLQQTGRLRTCVHTPLLQLPSLPACSGSSSCCCLPACTRVTAQISRRPTPCRPIASVPASLPAAVQMWATCNPGTTALVSRVPYEPAASHSLLPRSPPGAAWTGAVQRPRLSASPARHPQDERTQSRADGPDLRFWKKTHAVARPSFRQPVALPCLSVAV